MKMSALQPANGHKIKTEASRMEMNSLEFNGEQIHFQHWQKKNIFLGDES